LAVGPDVPLWLVCPYDVRSLDVELIGEAHHNDPAVIEHNDYRGSITSGAGRSCWKRRAEGRPHRQRRVRSGPGAVRRHGDDGAEALRR
jgi:hypothetical protein